MSADLPTRREILKAAAAIGVTALANESFGQTSAPTSQPQARTQSLTPPPVVGIQIGAGPLARGDIDSFLENLRKNAGINTLFVFAFGHEARFIPMAQQGFRGGNYSIPHMEFYKDANLTYDDMRAPEFPEVDLLDRTMKATRKHGFKTYAIIEEAEGQPETPAWQAFYEIDFHGRRQRDACSNNPHYRAFTLGLFEDYTRSYDVDGFMWSSERQGGLTNAIGARHGNSFPDPGKSTCFCEYCTKKGTDQGINVARAKEGFIALEQFVRTSRSGNRPRDGYFVSFMRLMLKFPELLQWESFWINSRMQLMTDIRTRVKSINPKTPVGFHVWHNASFSPFYRAEIDFAEMAKISDFIKPVVYNTCAGGRVKTFINSVGQTIFGDVPPDELLHLMYEMLDYKEAPFDQVAAAGFSTDYITREVKRTLDDIAGSGVPVYAGLDCDIPGAGAPYSADSVKQSVLSAFKAGAGGVVFARNYGEMNPDHVTGIGAAVRELGIG